MSTVSYFSVQSGNFSNSSQCDPNITLYNVHNMFYCQMI